MFKRAQRVDRKLFAKLMKEGNKISSSHFFIVRYKKNEHKKGLKFSVVVSKKIESQAVNRNNVRRRVYHAIHDALGDPPTSLEMYDIIFFIKLNLKKINFETLKLEINKIFNTIVS